jgi:DNA-binding response OmpR family regulator/HPt (histidine-containing phosphotransfer) domain-containing protein
MKKILIIEDDMVIANIYGNKYKVAGYQVEVAPDGEKGLAAVAEFKPDLIHLDLLLPKLNGVDLLKSIRSREESKTLPVIVLSNSYLSNMVSEAWKAGATKCLSKTDCTPKLMVEIVSKILNPPPPPEPKAPEPAPAAPSSSGPPANWDADAAFHAEMVQAFFDSAPKTLNDLRKCLQGFVKADSESARTATLLDLYRKVHSITGGASIAGSGNISQFCAVFEALLKDLYEKPKGITASTLRTVAQAVDFLAILYQPAAANAPEDVSMIRILVVDDEPLSRRAVCFALEKAKLQSVAVEDPAMGLKMLEDNKFGLVFLDIEMPGMNGFELCEKLRAMPAHKSTPVVFVTSLTDFESRARSTLSGGSDLIAKPFVFLELAVKALVYAMRSRLEKTPQKPA